MIRIDPADFVVSPCALANRRDEQALSAAPGIGVTDAARPAEAEEDSQYEDGGEDREGVGVALYVDDGGIEHLLGRVARRVEHQCCRIVLEQDRSVSAIARPYEQSRPRRRVQ